MPSRDEASVTQHDQTLALNEMFDQWTNMFREMNDRIGRLEPQTSQNAPRQVPTSRWGDKVEFDEVSIHNQYGREGADPRKRTPNRNPEPRRISRRRDEEIDNNLGSIKLSIPTFQGKSDPEAYLNWEERVELMFECHNYSEEKKVKLVVIKFIDYAILWWDQLVMSRRRNLERPIQTWDELKAVMRRRFVPSHYYRELHNSTVGNSWKRGDSWKSGRTNWREDDKYLNKPKPYGEASREMLNQEIRKKEKEEEKEKEIRKKEKREEENKKEKEESPSEEVVLIDKITLASTTSTPIFEDQSPIVVEIQAPDEEIGMSTNLKFVEEATFEDEVIVNAGYHNDVVPSTLEENTTPIIKDLNFVDPFWCNIFDKVQVVHMELLIMENAYQRSPYTKFHDSRSNRFEEGENDANPMSIGFTHLTPTRHVLDSMRKHVQWRLCWKMVAINDASPRPRDPLGLPEDPIKQSPRMLRAQNLEIHWAYQKAQSNKAQDLIGNLLIDI